MTGAHPTAEEGHRTRRRLGDPLHQHRAGGAAGSGVFEQATTATATRAIQTSLITPRLPALAPCPSHSSQDRNWPQSGAAARAKRVLTSAEMVVHRQPRPPVPFPDFVLPGRARGKTDGSYAVAQLYGKVIPEAARGGNLLHRFEQGPGEFSTVWRAFRPATIATSSGSPW
jgi:hypothetical protein